MKTSLVRTTGMGRLGVHISPLHMVFGSKQGRTARETATRTRSVSSKMGCDIYNKVFIGFSEGSLSDATLLMMPFNCSYRNKRDKQPHKRQRISSCTAAAQRQSRRTAAGPSPGRREEPQRMRETAESAAESAAEQA